METFEWILIAIAVAAVVAVAVVVMVVVRKRRSARLRDQFGPEYDRTVERADSRRDGEHDLRDRAEKRDQLEILPLSHEACDRYSHEWEQIQQRFVDEPALAVTDADGLLTTVMRDRGYPVHEDFEARVGLISVDHPELVDDYRGARRVRERSAGGEATTEEQREAFLRYRSLFGRLLVSEDRDSEPADHHPTSPR